MRRLLFVLLSMVVTAIPTLAQTPSGVADLVQRGLEGNLDLARLRWAVADAQEELPWESQLSNTKVSLSGGYDVGGAAGGGVTAQASLDVPIIKQFSLGASVSSQGTAGASLSLSPFTAALTRYKETEAYRNAVVELAYQTASVGYQIESAAYGVLQATDTLELARDRYALSQKAREIAEKSYELGGIAWDDLEEARKDLTTARQVAYDAEKAWLSARVRLYQLMGPADNGPGVTEVTIEELEAAIAQRDASIAATADAQVMTAALAKSLASLTSLQAQLEATPTYRPNLSLGARLAYTGTPTSTVSGSGSLSFSFSPSDIHADERSEIQVSIAARAREIELERQSVSFQADVAARALEVSRAALEGRVASSRQAQSSLEEASLLYEQGQRTEIEVEESRQSVREAQIALRSAAVSVLGAQADVLLLRVLAATAP